MSNIKLKDHYWETSGIYDKDLAATQRSINATAASMFPNNRGTEIVANTNVTTLVSVGRYYSPNGTRTGTLSGLPTGMPGVGFTMEIIRIGAIYQRQINIGQQGNMQVYLQNFADASTYTSWIHLAHAEDLEKKLSFFNGKKALIIGDSYNKNNPYGWGYYFKIVTGMGNNVTSIQQNGGGFGKVAASGSDYPGEYHYQAISHVSTDIQFDYIVAQSGRNDAYSPEDTTGDILVDGINQFVSVCRTRWPNANIYIIPTNNDSPLDDAHYKFMKLIPETALANGVFTSFESFKWFYDTNLNHSDGAHLTSDGYNLLAQYIAGSICGWNGILPKQAYDHKNLLKNSIFSRFIINTRGIGTGSSNITPGSTNTKFIDGWKTARSVVHVNNDSVSLAWDGTNSTNGYIVQHHVPISAHAHITMSAIINGVLYYKPYSLKDDQTDYNYYPISTVLMRVTISGNEAGVTIYNYSTTAITISAVKLEYGNEQTLATKYEGNLVVIDGSTYNEEINKCRTVLIPMYMDPTNGSQVYTGVRGYSSPRSVILHIPDMLKMYGTPTLEYSELQGAIVDCQGTSRSITAISTSGKFGVIFTVADDLALGPQAIHFNRIVYITSE